MNRNLILSHSQVGFPVPFPAAMPSSTTPGMLTDTTAPLPAPLAPTSRSTIAAITSPEMALACLRWLWIMHQLEDLLIYRSKSYLPELSNACLEIRVSCHSWLSYVTPDRSAF